MTTILKLKVGDHLRDNLGARGKVVGFERDAVITEWPGGRSRYTDADLTAYGVVKAGDFDYEDTNPE